MKSSKLSESKRPPPLSALLILLVLLIFLIEASEIFLHPLRIPAEAALQIEGTQIALVGKIPYIDFYSDAAPLLFYFLSLPVALAKLGNLHPIFAFNLFVLFLSWLSVGLIAGLLKNDKSNSKSVFIILFSLLPYLFRFQFGQVEYIFLILFAPFAVARWLSVGGRQVKPLYAVIVGIAGGVAVNLSVLFIIYPILLELFWILEKQSHKYVVSTELKTMLMVCVSYWLHLCVYPANISHAFFHCMETSILIQATCHDGYLVWEGSSPDQKISAYSFALLTILALLLRQSSPIIMPLVLVDFMAFLIFVTKGRGTSTDLLLVNFASLMLLPIMCFALAKLCRLPFIIGRKLVTILAIAFSSCFLIYQFWIINFEEFESLQTLGYCGYQNKKDLAPFADLLQRDTRPGDRVLILSNDVKPAFPLLLQLRRMPSSYYLTGFPIALMQLAKDEGGLRDWWQKDIDSVETRLACDLLINEPSLILIESGSPWDTLENNSLGRVLKERYKSKSGKSMWDIEAWVKESGCPIECVGERRDLDVYAKKEKEVRL